MDCSCTASHPDCDDNLRYVDRILKAAKQHICCECNGTIAKGEKFVFMTLFYPESISNYKMCLHCSSITGQFFRDGWVIGAVLDDLENYIDSVWVDDLPSNCLSKLTPIARDRVCDMLQQYQEEY